CSPSPSMDVTSSSLTSFHSELIPQLPQFLPNLCIQLCTLRHLLPQLFRQFLHFLGKGFVVIFDFLGTHITPWRNHMPVLCNLRQRHAAAEPGHILVFGNRCSVLHLTPPCGNGFGNPVDVFVCQLALHT